MQLAELSKRKDMPKRKHGKDFFSFGFKKKALKKTSGK